MHDEADTTIEIEVKGRWAALALSRLLIPFHSFLVQHDHERWVIHARAPGCRGESLSDALAAVDGWQSGQRSGAASCRVGGRPYHFKDRRKARKEQRAMEMHREEAARR